MLDCDTGALLWTVTALHAGSMVTRLSTAKSAEDRGRLAHRFRDDSAAGLRNAAGTEARSPAPVWQ